MKCAQRKLDPNTKEIMRINADSYRETKKKTLNVHI